MNKESKNEYKPQIVSAPGATIADLLEEKNITQGEFAYIMELPLDKIENLINGKEDITNEIANKLEDTLGVSFTFWMNRERRYREYINSL